MEWLYDARSECWSILTSMTAQDFLTLASDAHSQQGGISGQRDVQQTTSAKRIRERMVRDIRNGAVLPPIVLGVVKSDGAFPQTETTNKLSELLPEHGEGLAIIDGMQRTAAIKEAYATTAPPHDKKIRVELWIAKNVQSMIYRMLVLNTGQLPWNLSRQVAILYKSLIDEIKSKVPEIEKITDPDNKGRRVKGGQFSTDGLIDMYLGFSLRKTNFDAKEAAAEQFSKLDLIDNVSESGFQESFYRILRVLTRLDLQFSRLDHEEATETDLDKFTKGRQIFDSQPARIGFAVAMGTYVLGRPGADNSPTVRADRLSQIEGDAETLIDKLASMDEDSLTNFLRLDILSEVLDKRVGQVGRYERQIFQEAFSALRDERFALATLEPCWRAG